MQQLEFKYKTEVAKNGSLLRMNSSLMNKSDLYNRYFYSMHLLLYPPEKIYSPQHQFEEDQLQSLLEYLNKFKEANNGECTNCEELQYQLQNIREASRTQGEQRWKALFQEESEQTLRLSKINAGLMDTIRQFEINRRTHEEQLSLFLNDYFELFKKLHINQALEPQPKEQTIRQQSTTKKRQRSKSIKRSHKSIEKNQKIEKQKTVIFQQCKQSGIQKQYNALNKLRQSAVKQTQLVRKQLVEILKTLKSSEENSRLLRRSLLQQLVIS